MILLRKMIEVRSVMNVRKVVRLRRRMIKMGDCTENNLIELGLMMGAAEYENKTTGNMGALFTEFLH